MTDVDDTDIFVAKLPDQPEQMFHVVSLQAARRLVHQKDLSARRDRAANFDELPRGNR